MPGRDPPRVPGTRVAAVTWQWHRQTQGSTGDTGGTKVTPGRLGGGGRRAVGTGGDRRCDRVAPPWPGCPCFITSSPSSSPSLGTSSPPPPPTPPPPPHIASFIFSFHYSSPFCPISRSWVGKGGFGVGKGGGGSPTGKYGCSAVEEEEEGRGRGGPSSDPPPHLAVLAAFTAPGSAAAPRFVGLGPRDSNFLSLPQQQVWKPPGLPPYRAPQEPPRTPPESPRNPQNPPGPPQNPLRPLRTPEEPQDPSHNPPETPRIHQDPPQNPPGTPIIPQDPPGPLP